MAAREERLTPATRNYVIFGLLFLVASVLAICDWVDPRERRGETDSALRLLVVTSSEDMPIGALVDVDGFNLSQIDPADAIAHGRELLDDDHAPAHRAVIAYADQHGYGFVALDLSSSTQADEPVDWALSETPPSSARFAVFSVGDVAVEGPRMHSAGLPEAAGLELDPALATIDGLRLSLYDHPDLTRLWTIEPNALELQARQVLDSRKLDDRRELLARDHAAWGAIAWPTNEQVPGSLAGAWERVQAAPIPGGLLLEVRRVRARVSLYRSITLEADDTTTLEFLPDSALRDDEPDESRSRQPCPGLPEQSTGEVVVAPDGSAVVVRQRSSQPQLFVFEHDGSDGGGCRARQVELLATTERAIGRPNAAGAMAWNYDDDWLHWWDRSGAHRLRVVGLGASSGPWWVDERLLAMIGERTKTSLDEPVNKPLDELELANLDFEPVLVLLATLAATEADSSAADQDFLRIELGTHELFGELSSDLALIDLRPTTNAELLVSTQRCAGAPLDDPQPCLHRIRGTAPLIELVPELAAGSRTLADALTVETLGPLPPHLELAIAADGSRVAWIDRDEQQLWAADLRGPQPLTPGRIDADATPESSLRISADGRLVLSEIELEVTSPGRELGSTTIPRAFLLDPAPPDPVAPPPEQR